MTLSTTVAAVRQAVMSAAEATLRQTGIVPQPQVHLFIDDPARPYVGWVTTRGYQRGDDAAWAIRGLGHPPAALPASRVLIVWEDVDLLISLNAPQPARERALVFLDATTDDHTITWYPFRASAGSDSPVDLRWGESRTARRPALPGPIEDLLDIWREGLDDEFAAIVDELEQGGYEYTAVTRIDNPPPSGEAVHHAIGAALASGEPAAVEQACHMLQHVLAAMAQDDPRRGLYLVDLCLMLQLRYENSGELEDVAQAVQAARDAASYPDGEPPAKRLNALGTALRIWYEQTGDPDALCEAITACRQAVEASPADDRNFGTCLANLAWALHARFMANGDTDSLDEATSAARRALDALDISDPRHETTAMTLGVLLHSSYSRTGDLAMLDEAIDLGRAALVDTSSTGWMLAARLINLGRALDARYRRTGDLDSLREAVRVERRALVVAPPDHADRVIYQLNLSETLRALFDRTDDLEILDEAFAVARDAVAGLPAGNPFRINHLANLAVIHQLRYAQTEDLAELATAEALLREALANAAATHPQRPALLSALGEVLHTRSRHTADAQLLDEAIRTTRDALASVAEDHPHRGMILRTLADLCETRHQSLDDEQALSEAIELLRAAATHQTSFIRGRVAAARSWGSLAASAGLTELAVQGFATAIELLPLLAARSLRRYDSEYWLSQFGGLASDAAALALELDTPERAVELLELGRTVLMAQALDIRTDLSTLRERDPRLADRFEWLSARLETEDEQPESRRALTDELDAVVAAVRELTGMDRFLLPPKTTELLAQAAQGPIVLVNVSEYRSDALLLTDDGLRVRSLPQLTPDAVGDQVSRFLTALRTDCRSPFRQARDRGEQAVADTLTWLWNTVGAPVLDTLNPAADQRTWWVPTGLLGFLPLHAATSQATNESMLNRVVSSYTPSVRALTHARTTIGEKRTGRTLVVGMPDTPGEANLPGALREIHLVAERAPDPHRLVGPDATNAAVTYALRHSAWAHFACHATTASSPSDSHLLLHDHEQRPLNATAISRQRLPSATLAYLSACETAVSTTDLADEVIHIASAFHLAGFPQVIGTLWTIDDDAAATVAELVYTELTTGHPDPNPAPTALHNALNHMRSNHPHAPSLWASHIHIGI